MRAAAAVMRLGPRAVVVKRGEHGVLVFHRSGTFALPAMPLARVTDPTGAGDAFAGGFLGYLASQPVDGEHDLRRAAVVGSVMASFQVEDFSLDRLKRLTDPEIRERYATVHGADPLRTALVELLYFTPFPTPRRGDAAGHRRTSRRERTQDRAPRVALQRGGDLAPVGRRDGRA